MVEKTMRYSADELSLIKGLFKEQDDLLIALRKYILQGELTAEEMLLLSPLKDPKAIAVIKKTICPDLDKGAPFGQTVDLFSGMDVTPTPIDHALLQIESRKKANTFLNQRLGALGGQTIQDPINFDELLDGRDDVEKYVNFITRNFLLGLLDGASGVIQLKILAERKETDKDKLKKDSTK